MGVDEGAGSLVVKFRCESCGQKIRVPRIHAGRRGKCPKCRNIVTVPQPEETLPVASQSRASDSKSSDKDSNIFDSSGESRAPEQQLLERGMSDRTFEDLQKLEERLGAAEPEPVAKRKLPWFIDIFLYPVSVPGLTIFAIVVGVPLLIGIAIRLFRIFGFFLAILGFVINMVIVLYMYWYYCECIRDSAGGGIRAPETLVNNPSLGDMFWQLIKIIACVAFYSAPVLVYFLNTRKVGVIFWWLFAYGVFFFPMGLLAIVMFDSFSAFNPIVVIGSIFSTFFPYCGLILIFCGFALIAKNVFAGVKEVPLFAFAFHCGWIYMGMVAAHLLGRFYFRYEKKLNWEV